ncbi:MAG: murein biosynthesis integral membrane protein MurJ [Dethiobacteria bacterium]
MSQSKKTAKSVFIMIVFGIGGKLLGFIREMFIASKFGSGMETDTFFIALSATGLFTSFLTGSLSTTMIPVMSEVEAIGGKIEKRRHTNNLLNITILISLAIVVLGWFFSPLIIKVLAYGFEGKQLALAVTMMKIGMPVIIFAAIVGIYRGYLQSELMFLESAAASFPFNFTYIFFLIFLSGVFGIKGLMVTSVLAVGAQILIQLPGIKKTGYRYQFFLDIKDQYIKKIFYLVLPVLVSVTINDLNTIVDRALASTLIEGSISALNYSNRLKSFILTIFISAIATVLFPMLSKEAVKESHDNFKKLIRKGFNVILLITIPATIGMISLAKPIVSLAFERGAFDPVATQMTSVALLFYSLGLVGMAVRTLINRVYYSLQDTKTPMLNAFISLGLNIGLNLILIRSMAHSGLALATSIATTVTTGSLIYGLRKKIGSIGVLQILKCGLKSLASSLVMGILVYLTYYPLENKVLGNTIFELAVFLGVVSFGAAVYLVMIYLLKVDEVSWFVNLFKRKLKKKRFYI